MKILITDYPDVLGRELEKEIAYLHEDLPDAEILVYPYTDPEAFYREAADADGLLTAFILSSNCKLCITIIFCSNLYRTVFSFYRSHLCIAASPA